MDTWVKSKWQKCRAFFVEKGRLSARRIAIASLFVAVFAVATLVAQRAAIVLISSDSRFTQAEHLEGERLFSEKVKPILNRKCGKCHGEDDARSGLRVDSREGLLCGGHRGPAVTLGDPDNSLLIKSVLQTGELKMPRRGKLSPEEIQSLSVWIRDGAPWPQETSPSWKQQLEKVMNCVL